MFEHRANFAMACVARIAVLQVPTPLPVGQPQVEEALSHYERNRAFLGH
ncbi:hypothetical protein [Corynebacterium minutissimum]|nr:hypothetical protein [Corynebacterium minutissimum]